MLPRLLKVPDQSFFLLGPRGTGKSTWIRQHFPRVPTYDLLLASEVLRVVRDSSVFRKECDALEDSSWVVIDEVQKAPVLLDEVQYLIEARRQKFVLSGSSARKLKRGGANLLSGRALVKRMFPFVLKELDYQRELEQYLEFGSLPIAVSSTRPRAILRAYVETYLKEEIQAEALVRNVGSFARFIEVAARMNGQVVNLTSVARDAQVSRHTVQGFFEILTDTLVGHWLPAWKLKRSVKQVAHPKFHLFDAGVVRHMAGTGHTSIHPEEKGFLFETCLLHEIRAYLHYTELEYPLFYWRTHDGAEVDLVVETRDGLLAIEMKCSDRWDPRFERGLLRFRGSQEDKKVRCLGVYTGDRPLLSNDIRVLPWKGFLRGLWEGAIVA